MILGLYDILSIQKYVYSSSRLRDNIGAAIIVDKCLNEYMEEALNNVGEKYENNKKTEEFKAFKDKNIKIETIYSGGGNSLIYFKTLELYKKLNLELSKIFIDKAPGVKFATTYIETDFNGDFGKDIDYLFKKLQLKKYNKKDVNLAKGISITRECKFTKAPATFFKDEEYISEELFIKRSQTEQSYESKYKELNDLSGKEGEKFIAVVHIDGNEMGKQLRKYLKNCDSYSQGITRVRKFSNSIQEIYDNAYEHMKNEIKTKIEKSETEDERIRQYKNKVEPPFRKIYIKGDDVTFVCYAPIALKAVEIFLNKVKNDKTLQIELSACAGIAFVKPTYPFDVAYSIAEQCCSYAKKVAKTTAKEKDEKVGSYIDFHLAHSNMLRKLSDDRQLKYNIDFLNKQSNQEYGRDYNLILRPYKVSEDKNDITNLNTLFIISKWIKKSGIAKSKLKELRNAYITNTYKLNQSLIELKGQKKDNKKLDELYSNLKEIGGNLGEDEDREKNQFIDKNLGVCVLYDALELMDLYVEM